MLEFKRKTGCILNSSRYLAEIPKRLFWAFAITWAFFLSRIHGQKCNAGVDYNRSVRVSLASLAGLLTPMNVGTDVLRSWFGKKYLDLEYALTGAASVRTRECKVHVTLGVASAVSIAGASLSPVLTRSLAVVLAGLLGFALVLLVFRSAYIRVQRSPAARQSSHSALREPSLKMFGVNPAT